MPGPGGTSCPCSASCTISSSTVRRVEREATQGGWFGAALLRSDEISGGVIGERGELRVDAPPGKGHLAGFDERGRNRLECPVQFAEQLVIVNPPWACHAERLPAARPVRPRLGPRSTDADAIDSDTGTDSGRWRRPACPVAG